MTAHPDRYRVFRRIQPSGSDRRLLAVVLAALLLAGCSSVQFFYNQLDWLVPFYLETYVELDDHQRTYLEQQVENLLKWHCATHLTEYARLLRQANTDFQADRMDETRLLELTRELERYWFEVTAEAAPAIANLLLTATDEQINELFKSFEARSDELRESLTERSEKEARDDYTERMRDELERWFGPLTEPQREAVSIWGTRFVPLGEEALKTRQRWQTRLHESLAQRKDIPAFRRGIEQLLLDVRELRTPSYQARLEHNRDVTIELVEMVGHTLNAAQREHLASQVERYARDFEALSCTGRSAPALSQPQDTGVF